MSHQRVYGILPLMLPKEGHQDSTGCDRITKFRGREVKNILMDLDQSFNPSMHNKEHPPELHPHPFYSTASHYSNSSHSSSQRSLIHRYNKKQRGCQWSCCCKLTLGFVILVLLAWGIAVPLYFLIGPGIQWIREAPVQTAAEALGSPIAGHQMNGTVQHAVNGSLRIINHRYSHELSNLYSGEYQTLKLKLETLLSVVYQVEEDFNKGVVTDFRPGSVVASFVLIYNKNQVNVKLQAKSIMHTYLVKHWSMLGTYHIDLGSVTFTSLQNECALNNAGCSHFCVWNVIGGRTECTCPQNHRLLSDHKTCSPTKVMRIQTTMNPCKEGEFACRSWTCIPHQWMCDGVSDCLTGEDETKSMCEALSTKMLSQNTTKGTHSATGTNRTSTQTPQVEATLSTSNTLTSGTQIEPMPRGETSSTEASKTTHSFNSSIVKGNYKAAVREQEEHNRVEKKSKSFPRQREITTKKPYISGSKNTAFRKTQRIPSRRDFFDVPTLDLEIDPEGEQKEFSKRKQFSFKYFGR